MNIISVFRSCNFVVSATNNNISCFQFIRQHFFRFFIPLKKLCLQPFITDDVYRTFSSYVMFYWMFPASSSYIRNRSCKSLTSTSLLRGHLMKLLFYERLLRYPKGASNRLLLRIVYKNTGRNLVIGRFLPANCKCFIYNSTCMSLNNSNCHPLILALASLGAFSDL